MSICKSHWLLRCYWMMSEACWIRNGAKDAAAIVEAHPWLISDATLLVDISFSPQLIVFKWKCTRMTLLLSWEQLWNAGSVCQWIHVLFCCCIDKLKPCDMIQITKQTIMKEEERKGQCDRSLTEAQWSTLYKIQWLACIFIWSVASTNLHGCRAHKCATLWVLYHDSTCRYLAAHYLLFLMSDLPTSLKGSRCIVHIDLGECYGVRKECRWHWLTIDVHLDCFYCQVGK